MDTDQAGEVSMDFSRKKSCAYLKDAIRYSYAGAIR